MRKAGNNTIRLIYDKILKRKGDHFEEYHYNELWLFLYC